MANPRVTNSQAGKYGPAFPNGGYSVFENIAGALRQVGFDEYQSWGWPKQSVIDSLVPCTDAILDAMPRYTSAPPITVPPAQPPAGGWPVHLDLALDEGTASGRVG